MTQPSQKRAKDSFRERMRQKGHVYTQVMTHERDRVLIKDVARQLVGEHADEARARLHALVAEDEPPGAVLEALRASPLAGLDLDLTRDGDAERPIAL